MARINSQGYLERKSCGKGDGRNSGITIYRNWFLIKYNSKKTGYVNIGFMTLPEEYIGKRVRFKIEVIKEKEANK